MVGPHDDGRSKLDGSSRAGAAGGEPADFTSADGEGVLKLEAVTCSNCGGADFETVATGKDHEYPHTSPDTFRMVRCRCGLMYLNPRPTVAELDTIYPADYYAYQIVEQRLRTRGGKGSLLRRYMDAQAVRRWRAYVSLVRDRAKGPYEILDIGCGDGNFLNQWKLAFDGQAKTHGVEMNEKAAAIAEAQGHRVLPKRIEECDLERAFFDLVFSFHVVEHVEDPVSFMTAIGASLKPSGYALIETPNVDTVDLRMFGERHWGGYHFPRHWNLYDEKSFTALAEKSGLRVVRFEYVPSAIFWVWTFHSMLLERFPRLADRAFPPVDVFLRGGPWIWGLLSAFTGVDLLNRAITGKTASMRVLLQRA
jgi:2-polyprenyl-3-methyl-5-hydroxy-6-metoxy-1,4-benzoquinol methylase